MRKSEDMEVLSPSQYGSHASKSHVHTGPQYETILRSCIPEAHTCNQCLCGPRLKLLPVPPQHSFSIPPES